MTKRIERTFYGAKKEQEMLKKLSDYCTSNEFNPIDKQTTEKLKEYLYSLFEIKMRDMDFEPMLFDKVSTDANFRNIDHVGLVFAPDWEESAGSTHGSTVKVKDENGIYRYIQMSIILPENFSEIKNPKDVYQIVENLYHEINHVKQGKLLREEVSSKEALSFAYGAVLGMNHGAYNEKNYYKMPFELDSYSNFELDELCPKSLFGGFSYNEKNAQYYKSRTLQYDPRLNDSLADKLDSKITVDDIKSMPILNKKYVIDTNGNVRNKTTIELLKAMNSEISTLEKRDSIKDCREMYFELIYKSLKRENLADMDFQKINEMYGHEKSLFIDMSEYFESQLNTYKQHYDLWKRYENDYNGTNPYKVGEINGVEKYYMDKINLLSRIEEQKVKQKDKQQDYNKTEEQNEDNSNYRSKKSDDQEMDINSFVRKFMASYKRLETDAQYDKRLDREESDIEYVAEYVNDYRANRIDHKYFLGIQPDFVDKTGIWDFSKNNIDRMYRMLNAARNISIGNHQYLKTFCMSPEVLALIEQMQQSPEVQRLIKDAEIAKNQGKQGASSFRGPTPAEKDYKDASIAFKEWKEKGYSDDKIFDSIIDRYHMEFGYETVEELALAKVCCRQRGIKTQSRDLQGKYKLDIVDQTQNQNLIDPQTVKQDTIVAGINISEINKKIKEIKNHVLNVVKGEKADMNR